VQDLEHLLAGFDYLGEWEGRRKDGTAVWVDIKTTILRDTGGTAIGLIGIARNITARKEAEERLRQSEKHFRALVENNADGIALTDENGIITYASPSTTRMVGYLPEEFVGSRIFGRKDYPDGGEATRRLMARVLEEPRKSQELEIRTGHKNGTFLWMEIIGINLLDEPGVESIVWNFRDVTQRKQLEQEVAKANEQLEVILQNVADGITVVDANDRLVYVNDIAAHRLGFPSLAALLAAQQAGKVHRHEKFTVWDEWGRPLPVSERPIAQALRGKQAKALVQYQDNSTGQIYWTLTRAHPIFDAQGQVQLVINVYTDVTEQKELEQRKDHFISMASHELKTPLTILSAHTQLLRERFAAEDRQEVVRQLSKMDDQVTMLTNLVADLLDISSLQAGRVELARDAVDMDGLLHEVVANLQPTTSHHLLIEGGAQRPITGDRERLGHVLIILLTNAIKYSPQADSVVVRVAYAHDALTVSVQDFGIGIARSHQQRLFERFYRVLSKKDQTYPGLGIGLYIAYEIIQRHGGKMWLESVEGNGSTFFFSLPTGE
jgi:PAS domain S-box-containing protein